jgi:hypothetical protein
MDPQSYFYRSARRQSGVFLPLFVRFRSRFREERLRCPREKPVGDFGVAGSVCLEHRSSRSRRQPRADPSRSLVKSLFRERCLQNIFAAENGQSAGLPAVQNPDELHEFPGWRRIKGLWMPGRGAKLSGTGNPKT